MEQHAGELKRRISDICHDPETVAKFAPCPRFDRHELSVEQIESIAEAAAEKAVVIARQNFYRDVGESVVNKWFIIIGMMTVGFYTWLRSKGIV
jgi:hypothetical protein